MDSKRSVGLELRMVSNLIRRRFGNSDIMKEVENITGTHGWAIGFLCNNIDRDVFQRDIEEEFRIRPSTATKILQLMEKNGLITRESVEYDARLKKIVLTEKALALHNTIKAEMERIENSLAEGLSDEELDCFFMIMEKIKNNIE